ncbi:MAG TPA: two-component system response regulator [Cyanobacteria bacterium UBA11149]|nr:two-component system response regulator [Cyanobacteria bacterium UBA11367]HBE56922.1 two-component system response regulator [Cyanobacteria bacterium UBA11366]HBK66902.1 two-component system response regulator [Cyanobacteria bacterium UBA11166]HBR73451.1 two-component system response regulator [Cyanobacteria bacterium UBA11159]HBS69333.1 two-component system response regulator [Cyanobacteria bacterium UBA11153]HBW89148.1 two-component system response regulator [Cyanobacteria bacterium UBA11
MNSHKKILLIDDEYRIREVTKMILELMGGWTVLTASSGYEGIAVAQSEHPDAILLDMMMPDFDGTQTLAKLQADITTKSIPILLLTAKALPIEVNQLSNGVKGMIEKPFEPLQLANLIARSLGW